MNSEPFCCAIIPTLNEQPGLHRLIESIASLRGSMDVIVVDGGSEDGTARALQTAITGVENTGCGTTCRILKSARGRARQMNHGAACSKADLLVFLHADTRLPNNAIGHLRAAWHSDRAWGRFDVRFDCSKVMMRVVAWFMNKRSALSGIATGDQAIFVRRKVFEQIGGYPELPLMEDIAISKRLRRVTRPYCIKTPVVTDARRWRTLGIFSTISQMWWFRLAYWAGVSPQRLASRYRQIR